MTSRDPIRAGVLLALLAAVAFGVTTPLSRRWEAGAFGTAALLYAGAALGAVRIGGAAGERQPGPEHWGRLAVVALLGAAAAPVLFAWGLVRVPATTGALLQNGEAVFTVLLAALLFREHVGRRVAVAVVLMFAGGAVSVAGASATGTVGLLGALAVVGAVLCWAADNVLTRPLAELSPTGVVWRKALLGAGLTGLIAIMGREPLPPWPQALGLLACGTTGYGMSLRLYLLAQRRVGAGRTGSVFATAPFAGALASIALGDRPPAVTTAVAAALFLAGLWLHLTEEHEHEHAHEAVEHEHTHRHDDGHHAHHHDDMPEGEHTHPHRHAPVVHAHPHAPDLHHAHDH